MKHTLIYLIPTLCMAAEIAPEDTEHRDSPIPATIQNMPVHASVVDSYMDVIIPQTNSPKPCARKEVKESK